MKIVRAADSDSMDPILMNYNESIWLCDLLYDTLLSPSDDGSENLKNMCDDYSISEDGKTWTFNLKKGLCFSDGSEIKAQDWLDTFTRLKNSKESIWNSPVVPVVSLSAPDDYTLVIELEAARAAFAAEIGLFSMSVQSKAHHEEYIAKGGDPAAYMPLSTGPYVVKEWVRSEYVKLEKNPYYADKDKISIEEITFMVVPDDNARVTMLQAGEADVVLDLPYSMLDALKQTQGVTVKAFDGAISRYIIFNTLDEKLSDIKVRKALRSATDQEQLIKMVTYGYAVPAASYLPPGDLYRIDIAADPYDIEKAKALLAEAGYPDGLELDMWVRAGNSEYEQIATILKEQWAKAGVKLNLTTMETAALVERQEEMQHTMVIGRWTEDINDPIQLSDYFWNYPVTQGYYTGWNDQELQALSLASQTELDTAKRAEMYKQLQEARYEYCAELSLYHPQYAVAISDHVQNFVLTPLGKYRLENTTILAD
ncbi:MAG: ABC transporter substrate-binding protein [Peptococcaceae bacterium]|nr:ABC transporter substrate-binding protein [Peptococcaceae bacterium]